MKKPVLRQKGKERLIKRGFFHGELMFGRFRVPPASAACAAVGFLLYGVLMAAQGGSRIEVSSLRRPNPGEGELQYEVTVRGLGEGGREMPITIPVGERQYTEEEANALYDRLLSELAERIRGENESLEAVRSDLNLVKNLEPYGISILWESDNTDLVDSFGTVTSSGVSKEGEEVWLKASLTDGIHDREYHIRATVLPPLLNEDEQMLEGLAEACRRMDLQQKTEEEFLLPETLGGKRLGYYKSRETNYAVIPILGVLVAMTFIAREKINEQGKKKRREQLLLLDYSEIVSKFMVFTGAGMSIRTTWERIVSGYDLSLRMGKRKQRPAYEEMRYTAAQLQSGTAESIAYGEFGRRCGLQPYVKLAALLEQNRKTGSKNLKSALEIELTAAFEQRKNLAKKLGEEAGTKLLLPLFLLLGVVMVMIVVPAFLTFY